MAAVSLKEVGVKFSDLHAALAQQDERNTLDTMRWFRTNRIPGVVVAGAKLIQVFQRIRNNSSLSVTIRAAAADVIQHYSTTSLTQATRAEALKKETPFSTLYRRLATAEEPATTIYDAVPYAYDDNCTLDRNRVQSLHKGDRKAGGPVVYWMQRDQRVLDNWALIQAQRRAMKKQAPLVVVFALAPEFINATARQYGFMLRGLKQVEADLASLHIPFRVLLGNPPDVLPQYLTTIAASCLVTDFSPLRVSRAWKAAVKSSLAGHVMFEEVDTHNVVPVWAASSKLETGARTIRTKLHNGLRQFAGEFPRMVMHSRFALPVEAEAAMPRADIQGLTHGDGRPLPSPAQVKEQGSAAGVPMAPPSSVVVTPGIAPWLVAPGSAADSDTPAAAQGRHDWSQCAAALKIDWSVPEVSWALPGERAAAAALDRFLTDKVDQYGDHSNNPNRPGARSCLSPYLHFGQLSTQRVLLECIKHSRVQGSHLEVIAELFRAKNAERITGMQVFLEEVIVRKELSDNFCHYSPQSYDNFDGCPSWARVSLNLHRGDVREHVYSLEEFEAGATHEDLWNAAQMELVHTGKMHGYMRMYWAKKILEWTEKPEEALRVAIYLNDRYSLDGRDPSGYVGCMWAIGGVHDQGWKERNVFGKIRYMNKNGASTKFSVSTYVQAHYPVRPLLAADLAVAASKRHPPPAETSSLATEGTSSVHAMAIAQEQQKAQKAQKAKRGKKRRLQGGDGDETSSGEDESQDEETPAAAGAGGSPVRPSKSARTAVDDSDDDEEATQVDAAPSGVRLKLTSSSAPAPSGVKLKLTAKAAGAEDTADAPKARLKLTAPASAAATSLDDSESD